MQRIGIEVLERSARGGTWWYDLASQEIYWSDGIYRLLGVERGDVSPNIEFALSFYTPESRALLEAAIERASEKGDGYSLTVEICRADGKRRFVQAIGRAEMRDGRAPMLAGALLDVHEQTRARNLASARERRLLEETRRWRTACENAGLGLIDLDVAQDSCRVYGQFNQRIGLGDADETVMRLDQWREMVHDEDRAGLAAATSSCVVGESASYVVEYRFRVPGRGEIWIEEVGSCEGPSEQRRLVSTVADITARKRAQELLKRSQLRLRQTLGHAPIGIALVSPEGHWLSANHELCRMLDYDEGELLQGTFQDITHPEDLEADLTYLHELLAGERSGYRMDKRYVRKNGELIDVQLDVSLLRDEQAAPLYFISHIQDITERKRAHRALFEANELAEVTFEAIGEGVIRIDASGTIAEVNSAAASLLAAEPAQLQGQPFEQMVRFYDPDELHEVANPVSRVLQHGDRVRVPIFTRLRRQDDQYLSIVDSISPIHDATGEIRGAVFVFQDISDARRLNEDLVHQASHDALTELPNRRGFGEELARTWSRVQVGALSAFVMYVDLDHFKTINDTCGHAAGDELLRRIAQRLRSALRESDVLARLGGDEFAAIVHARDAAGAQIVAQKIVRSIAEMDFVFEGRRYAVGVSVGIAPLDRNLQSTDAALIHADAALYVAKERGRGRYHLYDAAKRSSADAERYLDTAQLLYDGLDQDMFTLYLQAIVDAADEPVGYEALLRFDGPDGIVEPDTFLPTARRLGMMKRIDRWVVSRALAQLDDYRRRNQWPTSCYLSINLSAASAGDPEFADELMAMLDARALDPAQLVFEVSESEALSGEHYPQFIENLRGRGYSVWLDDFASGYNGFDLIRRASVDGIKIDRSFVRDLENDPINRAVVRSITDISRTLQLGVIAEGVETASVRALLVKAGIQHFQGYLFHEPVPADIAFDAAPAWPTRADR